MNYWNGCQESFEDCPWSKQASHVTRDKGESLFVTPGRQHLKPDFLNLTSFPHFLCSGRHPFNRWDYEAGQRMILVQIKLTKSTLTFPFQDPPNVWLFGLAGSSRLYSCEWVRKYYLKSVVVSNSVASRLASLLNNFLGLSNMPGGAAGLRKYEQRAPYCWALFVDRSLSLNFLITRWTLPSSSVMSSQWQGEILF